ncbi:MAG: PQQ-binding-like beta-propeller repeat protein [Planctomycetota bacterium]|nr:PQQ-binding-like beta-propeller repeat protein [Planctomycetota bacterium]
MFRGSFRWVIAVLGCGLVGCCSEVQEISVATFEELAPPDFNPEGDSPWWRGPTRDGKSTSKNPPTNWSDTENIAWTANVPGHGHGSPTVWGEHVFVQTADTGRKSQSVLCYSRSDGRKRWETRLHSRNLPSVHENNSCASATMAVDGERAFALFENDAKLWLTALDFNGKQLWQTNVGPVETTWGYGTSPMIYKSFVIVACDGNSQAFLAAVHRKSGKIVWRTKRPSKGSYSPPVVARVNGKDQLLLSGNSMIASYDPADGSDNWSIAALMDTTCGTIVWDGELLFNSGGYPGSETVCVKADGSEVVWKNAGKCYEQSMLAHDGYLYAVNEGGIANCHDAKTGQLQWKKRLGGKENASLVLANGNLYHAAEDGATYVFAADPGEYRQIAKNQLGHEVFATPTICGDQIFVRVAFHESSRQERLICISRPPTLASID